jgi:hypothetical protein
MKNETKNWLHFANNDIHIKEFINFAKEIEKIIKEELNVDEEDCLQPS